ncbi:MAG: DNA polymerase III subunit alpha [Alphaproteobacteria bacterium]|nr:DNA polymerase III subunit alpha [Alphaproteobacteria bacterium]
MTTEAASSVLPLSPFIHLRVHTAYSLLEGAVKIKKLTGLCEQYRMPAVAMTDTNNLFGAFEMSTECAAHGIQPIIGTQACIDMGLEEKRFNVKDPDAALSDVVLLVQNEAGYNNLRLQSEQAYMFTPSDEKPHVPYDKLKDFSDGLICLTGGVNGPVGKLLLAGKTEKAEEALKLLMAAFPDRLYMEIQRHGTEDEEKTERDFLDLAYKYNVPLVATNEVFFIDKDMFEAHDALLCIKEKTHVIVNDRRRLNPEYYFKSPEEMTALFEDLPEAVENTVNIAKRCGFMVEFHDPALPIYPDCDPIGDDEQKARGEMYEKIRAYLTDDPKTGRTVQEQLDSRTIGELQEAVTVQDRARKGLVERLNVHVFTSDMTEEQKAEVGKPYQDRLEYELSVIIKMKFSGYFLIVSDFIGWSKAHGIPVGPGRGSGAGSVVAWSLKITDLDPLRLNLLFERFLNPERVNMPDFDVDFCQTRRGKTIEYVREKYGHDRVAQIITFGQMQAKVVIRDVGRVLQMDFVADKLARMVPPDPKMTLAKAYETEPEFARWRKTDQPVDHLLSLAEKLEGLYRNASTHAAGVVVGQKPLNQIVPVFRDLSSDSELPVTQYNMKFVESTGLIKFDFLGLKTLTVIQEAVNMANARITKEGQPPLNISEIDLADKATFELLQRAETDGVFQLESGGMRKVLRDLAPTTFEEIIAVISLYRPGPMDNIPSYINRKHGKEDPDYMHPMLEDILKETYGIMIYQEQVMQIAQKMGGYTMGGADGLRKVMGKKIKEKIPLEREKFVAGSIKNGIQQSLAESIFDRMAKFAEYGFNKSHAAAYALVTYQTAWLKTHYPVEFMAATMTYDMQNTDKLALYKKELARLKIKLLPPDVNMSFVPFAVENGAVRYALTAVKGAGEGAAAAVVAERQKKGPFKSVSDFIRRMDSSHLDKKSLETWIKAGAFDSLEKSRGLLHANLELLMKHARAANEEKASSQISLFGQAAAEEKIILTPAPEWTPEEKLKMESSVIGFYLSAHPLDRYEKSLTRLRTMSYAEVARGVSRAGSLRAKMGVTVSSMRERMSKKGSKYAFVAASDVSGSFEFTVFSDGLSRYRDMLKSDRPLLITVNAEKEEGSDDPRMILQHAEFLDDVISQTAGGIMIVLDREEAVLPIKNLIEQLSGGRSRILLTALADKWEVEIDCEKRYALTADILAALSKIQGVLEVKEL